MINQQKIRPDHSETASMTRVISIAARGGPSAII
jgi:hypothetical protein